MDKIEAAWRQRRELVSRQRQCEPEYEIKSGLDWVSLKSVLKSIGENKAINRFYFRDGDWKLSVGGQVMSRDEFAEFASNVIKCWDEEA